MISIEITYIICGILMVLSLLTPLFNVFFRKITPIPSNIEGHDLPPVSVIMVVENADTLERNLPVYLQQEYDPGVEYIVVFKEGDKDTSDVLKRLASHENVRKTFVPDSSRYMSDKKLAVTLGVKAARTEWIVLVEPASLPTGNDWLKRLASHFTSEKNLVMGYTKIKEATDFMNFYHHHTASYLIRHALKGIAFRTNMHELAFRKNEFIREDGYRGNLKYIRGEYDFLVNKFAKKNQTAVFFDQEAYIEEDFSSEQTWQKCRLFYQSTREHLQRRIAHRLVMGWDMTWMLIDYIAIVASAVLGVITRDTVLAVAAAVAFMLTYILRAVIAHRSFRQFGYEMPVWKLPLLEIGMIFVRLLDNIRYRRSNKYDFITHKL